MCVGGWCVLYVDYVFACTLQFLQILRWCLKLSGGNIISGSFMKLSYYKWLWIYYIDFRVVPFTSFRVFFSTHTLWHTSTPASTRLKKITDDTPFNQHSSITSIQNHLFYLYKGPDMTRPLLDRTWRCQCSVGNNKFLPLDLRSLTFRDLILKLQTSIPRRCWSYLGVFSVLRKSFPRFIYVTYPLGDQGVNLGK